MTPMRNKLAVTEQIQHLYINPDNLYSDRIFLTLFQQGLLTKAVSSYRRGDTGRTFDCFGSIIKNN